MICFAWAQFPQYAARCLGALVCATNERVVVVATRPRVPIERMDALAGCRVIWILESEMRSVKELTGEMPRVLFVSGWGTRLFNRFRDEVRAVGGKVIAMSDNNYRFSLKEVVKSIRFRLMLRGKYDGYFVPGRACVKLLRFYGISKDKIQVGMYAADASIFNDGGVDICDRPKKMIFVGQLCARKNPLRLCSAFQASGAAACGWSLDIYGCGPLKDRIPKGKGIVVHDFLQPEALAGEYRNSRVFCLPSLEEHWGLVVHEAALSGCMLLLSEAVGSKDDFVGERNGFLFPAKDECALMRSIQKILSLPDEMMRKASSESIRLGRLIGLKSFVRGALGFA